MVTLVRGEHGEGLRDDSGASDPAFCHDSVHDVITAMTSEDSNANI
jgi:hypothetical protein